MLTSTTVKRAVKNSTAKKTVAKKAAAKPASSPQPSKLNPALKWRDAIAHALDENKAEDITVLDLKDKCSFTDFMIVASGRSARHVAALADHVVEGVRKADGHVMSVEGKETGDWVLIDAGDVVVHIFRPEIRQFYNIEKMWAIPLPTA
jgi:ribosome-associated protein